MNGLETVTIQCPWCWEMTDITIDPGVPLDMLEQGSTVDSAFYEPQSYVEDCSVCCRPMTLKVTTSTPNGKPVIRVEREND